MSRYRNLITVTNKQFYLIIVFLIGFQLFAVKRDTTAVKHFKPHHEFRFTVGAQPYEVYYKDFAWFNNEPDYLVQDPYFNFTPVTYRNGARYTAGMYGLNYIYQLKKHLAVGATITYSLYYNSLFDIDTNAKVGRTTDTHLGIYPKLYFNWLQRPGFSIYQSIGIGPGLIGHKTKVGYITNQNTLFNLSGECTLLGFSVGKRVYAVGEILTFGSEGLLKLGVGYRFDSKNK